MRLRSVLLLLLLPLTALEQVNDERFLDCVVQKEGYTQDHIGPNGERSIYAITYAVWTQHMGKRPFALCTLRPDLARECALAHVRWLKQALAQAGMPQSPFTLGWAWHRGIRGYLGDIKRGLKSDYALEMANLYGVRAKNAN